MKFVTLRVLPMVAVFFLFALPASKALAEATPLIDVYSVTASGKITGSDASITPGTTPALGAVYISSGMPVFGPTPDITVVQNRVYGAIVNYNVTATSPDAPDQRIDISCNPASGSFFLGSDNNEPFTTTVHCDAFASSAGVNISTQFKVIVLPPPPPFFEQHEDIVKEATGPNGATVNYIPAIFHGIMYSGDNITIGACTPRPFLNFPIGTTDVNCYNIDAYHTYVTTSFKVIVVDTTKPVITLLGDNPQSIDKGVAYTELGATVTDLVDLNLQPIINTSTVNTNVAGSYIVTYDAVDTAGNHADRVTRVVNVIDNTPPVVEPPVTPPEVPKDKKHDKKSEHENRDNEHAKKDDDHEREEHKIKTHNPEPPIKAKHDDDERGRNEGRKRGRK